MSASSTIGNLKSALGCASKCDCCEKLQAQIDAINGKLITEAKVRAIAQSVVDSAKPGIVATTKSALEPGITSAVVGGITVVIDKLKPDLDLTKGLAKQGYDTAKATEKISNDALAKSLAEARARLAAEEALRGEISGIRSVANSAKVESAGAVGKAAAASKEALDAGAAVGGLKGLVNGISEKVDGFGKAINRLENAVGNAVASAARAVGISNEALAATGRLFGKVAEIFQIIGTFATLIEQLATLNTLGGRIDAVERGLEALGASVSGILGKLLGLQNRISRNEATIVDVRAIAVDARLIGEGAARIGGAAQITATRAEASAASASGKASQAQLTADGAVRNAKVANDNATTAYKKATEAQGISEQAKRIGLDALGKAGVALTTALTALALYQGIKSLRGLQGIPGIPGRQGERGFPGLQGLPGKNGINGLNGITTVVQIPGTTGKDGLPGKQGIPGVRGQRGLQGAPGIPGKDGKDVNPADLASLRGLIIQQHAQTRTVVNTTTSSLFGRLQAIIVAGNTALTALVTAIATNTYVEKALAVLTFAATIHNAFMLSNNLTQTLGTVIDQVVGLILPKGLDGTPINIGNILGKVAHELIADVIGEANYQTISQDWAKANRIYQAGANVFNQLSNMTGLLTAGMEVIGGNVGKIGNALKKWGVVGEAAYNFMNPQPNLKGKFFTFLNSANDELNTIVTMVAIPIGIGAAAAGINDSVSELTKALDQVDPKDEHGQPIPDTKNGGFVKYQPGLTQPVPTVTTTQAAQDKADSTNIIQATLDDIFNAND
ncbi:hypothetical protein [Nostoc sp.]|uniref:hypothetical protein n=1 Tax=Nostoc sp. TaxID=1180 RepID=UPI002FF9E204